jgi:hypothetical protein
MNNMDIPMEIDPPYQNHNIMPYPHGVLKPAGMYVNFKYSIYPLSFFHWYETPEYKQMEYSNKMIAPQKLFEEISQCLISFNFHWLLGLSVSVNLSRV